MADPILLVTGLGNPGPKYDQTRHNAGFWFVDELAKRFNGQFRSEPKFSSDICRLRIGSGEVWLQKPMSFMNRSGLPVRQMAGFYKIPLQQTLVVHDEIDLPPGKTKLKLGGGHGGHNGLRDIIAHFGKEFWRLRIGVGHPGHRDQVIDYVLGRPSREDEDLIMGNIVMAADVMPLVMNGDMNLAMNELHSGRVSEDKQ